MKTRILIRTMVLVLLASCTIVQPGTVGVRSKFGKLQDNVLQPGAHFRGFGTTIIVLPVGTRNIEINLNLPSKEGLNINSNISI